jgi:hypothetical protein
MTRIGAAALGLALGLLAGCGGSTDGDGTTRGSGGSADSGGGPGLGGNSAIGGRAGVGGGPGAGGAASGGSGNAGGGGAGYATCLMQCERVDCPGVDRARCAEDCTFLTSFPHCAPAIDAFYACFGTHAVVCDADGQGYDIPGCETQQLAAARCVLEAASDPALVPACTAYCTNIAASMCLDAQTQELCPLSCSSTVYMAPHCTQSWLDYVSCSANAPITCAEPGSVDSQGCSSQLLAAAVCLSG